jgi:hypothetical protein
MRWVLDGAIAAGLDVRDVDYARKYTLTDADANAPISRMDWRGQLAQTPPDREATPDTARRGAARQPRNAVRPRSGV